MRDILKTNPEFTDGIDFLSLDASTEADLIGIVRKHGRSREALVNQ